MECLKTAAARKDEKAFALRVVTMKDLQNAANICAPDDGVS